jgi:hypothetical protein
MIKIDWFISSPLDFEYKNYVLMGYLQSLDQSYGIRRLSPYLLFTEKLIFELNSFKLKKREFEIKLQKNIFTFDNNKLIISKTSIPEPDTIKLVEEIVDYSTPILESKVKLGYKLLSKYPQILF